jgi:hypothetical protein
MSELCIRCGANGCGEQFLGSNRNALVESYVRHVSERHGENQADETDQRAKPETIA